MKNQKKTILIIIVIVALIGLFVFMHIRIKSLKNENRVFEENQKALLETCQSYEYRDSLSYVSSGRVQLEIDNLKEMNSGLIQICEDLKIRLKDVESATRTTSETVVGLKTQVHDTTIIYKDTVIKAQAFTWEDNYTSVEGVINNDSVKCSVASRDTLTQIVHRIPHKFWFFKWGTKAIRQEVLSANPNTKLTYTEYIEIID